jgi:hypothetical protein
MKKLIRLTVGGMLIATFVLGLMATFTTVEAKPMFGCYLACNRTTYQIVECCPFTQKGEIVWKCHNTGDWCYPE